MVYLNIYQKVGSFFCWIYKHIIWLLSAFLLGLIKFYRYFISPFIAPSCRYNPTCSTYGLIAIKRFGPFIGGYLTIKRIFKCHPWGGHGYDPVPTSKSEIDKGK